MRWVGLVFAVCACGGELVVNASDATVDSEDEPDNDLVFFDGKPPELDAAPPQDVGCLPYVSKGCDGGCPNGSVCVMNSNQGPVPVPDPPPPTPRGCLPIPEACKSTPDCACMGVCANCSYCAQDPDAGMVCGSDTVSRREFKKDIGYVDERERNQIANQVLTTCQSRTDEYAFASMLLATIQRQQAQIEVLQKRVDSIGQDAQ